MPDATEFCSQCGASFPRSYSHCMDHHDSRNALRHVMGQFFVADCRKAIASGGIAVENQRVLVDGLEAMRERLSELERDMTEGRPELVEAMAEKVAKLAEKKMWRYATLSLLSAVDRATWDAMLELGFRGPDLRRRSAMILEEMAR